MQTPSLGEKIKELRLNVGISLRELSRRAEISAPHLSDIELGRRYPSENLLSRLASQLETDLRELKKLDYRSSLDDLKRMMHSNPTWGIAFKQMAQDGKKGTLSPEELIQKLTKGKE